LLGGGGTYKESTGERAQGNWDEFFLIIGDTKERGGRTGGKHTAAPGFVGITVRGGELVATIGKKKPWPTTPHYNQKRKKLSLNY